MMSYNLVNDEYILSLFVQICEVTSMFFACKQPLAVLRTDESFCIAWDGICDAIFVNF